MINKWVQNTLINKTLKDQPSINMKKGNFIRDGFSSDLDELRTISNDANDWMLNYQQKLKEETNISSLKISFNKCFQNSFIFYNFINHILIIDKNKIFIKLYGNKYTNNKIFRIKRTFSRNKK